MKRNEFVYLPLEAVDKMMHLSRAAILIYLQHRINYDYSRDRSNLTQIDISEIIGLHRSQVSRCEKELAKAGMLTRKIRGPRKSSVQLHFLTKCAPSAKQENSTSPNNGAEMLEKCAPSAKQGQDLEPCFAPSATSCAPSAKHIIIEQEELRVTQGKHTLDRKVSDTGIGSTSASESSSNDRAQSPNPAELTFEEVLAHYEAIVVPRTKLPPIGANTITIHTRSLIDAHMRRHSIDPTIVPRVFASWASTERLWKNCSITFSTIWEHRRGKGCSCFDEIAQGAFQGRWWTDPNAGDLPKLSHILAGHSPETWRYGVDVDCGVLNGTDVRYCVMMRKHAPELYRALVDRAQRNFLRGREEGVSDEIVSSSLCSPSWEPWSTFGGLIRPIVDEARGTS